MKFYLYPIFRIIIKFNWIQQKAEQNPTKCASSIVILYTLVDLCVCNHDNVPLLFFSDNSFPIQGDPKSIKFSHYNYKPVYDIGDLGILYLGILYNNVLFSTLYDCLKREYLDQNSICRRETCSCTQCLSILSKWFFGVEGIKIDCYCVNSKWTWLLHYITMVKKIYSLTSTLKQ